MAKSKNEDLQQRINLERLCSMILDPALTLLKQHGVVVTLIAVDMTRSDETTNLAPAVTVTSDPRGPEMVPVHLREALARFDEGKVTFIEPTVVDVIVRKANVSKV